MQTTTARYRTAKPAPWAVPFNPVRLVVKADGDRLEFTHFRNLGEGVQAAGVALERLRRRQRCAPPPAPELYHCWGCERDVFILNADRLCGRCAQQLAQPNELHAAILEGLEQFRSGLVAVEPLAAVAHPRRRRGCRAGRRVQARRAHWAREAA